MRVKALRIFNGNARSAESPLQGSAKIQMGNELQLSELMKL
jgi:hypothetical protein